MSWFGSAYNGTADHKGLLQSRLSLVERSIGPADHRGGIECLSLIATSPYRTLAGHRMRHTHVALDTFLPSHNTTELAMVPVDGMQQRQHNQN